MEVEPFLAESWTVSEDGLTIDMKLKEGVKYFDGTEMTAETVKYCWDWYLDPDTAANFYPLISDVQSVDAVDQYNLRFNFSQPNAGFIELMSYQAGYVLSPRRLTSISKPAMKPSLRARAEPAPSSWSRMWTA